MVMRREQILKICLNFALNDDFELKAKDETSLRFAGNDFSEGVSEPTFFAIRFKTADICEGFKEAISKALADASSKEPLNENSELVSRLLLPDDFFNYLNAPDCPGCLGCKSDEYVFSNESQTEESNELPLMPVKAIAKPKTRRASQDKRVSFKLSSKENQEPNVSTIFGGKDIETTPEKNTTDLFGSIKKSEANTNIFAQFNMENPASPSTTNTSIFGGKSLNGSVLAPSIFSSSLNTTPAANADSSSSGDQQPSLFGAKTSFSFGTVANGGSIFGAKEPLKGSFDVPKSGSIFGITQTVTSSEVKSENENRKTNIFSSAAASSFSFAEAAKDFDKIKDESRTSLEPEFLKNTSAFGGFAEIAATTTSQNAFNAQSSGAGGFVGLTVKNDFFSKNKQLDASGNAAADSSQNDSENVNDDNYDPHYDPIISLPDEIKVSTGEEDEEKLFGDRAKLFRYDVNTKEWKERGNKLFLSY
jgi:E3 SUMO-protein ligase RanBP2